MNLYLAYRVIGWWCVLAVVVTALYALSRHLVDYEPPQVRRRRRQLRALREIQPLERVWPDRTENGREWL